MVKLLNPLSLSDNKTPYRQLDNDYLEDLNSDPETLPLSESPDSATTSISSSSRDSRSRYTLLLNSDIYFGSKDFNWLREYRNIKNSQVARLEILKSYPTLRRIFHYSGIRTFSGIRFSTLFQTLYFLTVCFSICVYFYYGFIDHLPGDNSLVELVANSNAKISIHHIWDIIIVVCFSITVRRASRSPLYLSILHLAKYHYPTSFRKNVKRIFFIFFLIFCMFATTFMVPFTATLYYGSPPPPLLLAASIVFMILIQLGFFLYNLGIFFLYELLEVVHEQILTPDMDLDCVITRHHSILLILRNYSKVFQPMMISKFLADFTFIGLAVLSGPSTSTLFMVCIASLSIILFIFLPAAFLTSSLQDITQSALDIRPLVTNPTERENIESLILYFEASVRTAGVYIASIRITPALVSKMMLFTYSGIAALLRLDFA